MSAASRFFRLCRQLQPQSNITAATRHVPRSQCISQRRAFSFSSHQYTKPGIRGPLRDGPISTTLSCRNLAFGIKKETVLQAFGKFGILSARLSDRRAMNEQDGTWHEDNGGYCVLEFATREGAGAARAAMNNVEVDGCPIQLAYELSPSQTDGSYGRSDAYTSSLSDADQKYIRTQPLVVGTVTRTGTMAKTVAVTTNRRRLDTYTQTHHVRGETELVHDPQGILMEGDVIKYQHFAPEFYAERAARGKKSVKFILREVVTPFGVRLEERTSDLGVEQAPAEGKKKRKTMIRQEGSTERVAARAAS